MMLIETRRLPLHRWWQLGLGAVGAVLLAVAAGMHLDLYLTGYRSIPVIGWLFLLQVIAGFALAIAVVVTRSRLAAAAAALFALSTLGGYLLSVWVGLFGFTEVRTTAGIAAGVIEVAAFAALGLAAVLPAPARRAAGHAAAAGRAGRAGTAGRGDEVLARIQAAGAKLIPAVAGVAVVALALLGVAIGTASGGSATTAAGSGGLNTAQAGGVTVLTNAKGLTLYWFERDTPTKSNCTGSCSSYWPPLTGSPAAPAGVPGKFATITRQGGASQVTYNGHPLYTYVGDSHRGQASGNNLNLNGGVWHEAKVSG
jgi:predicted lipoprotein with Yx(FWY)xxD motif